MKTVTVVRARHSIEACYPNLHSLECSVKDGATEAQDFLSGKSVPGGNIVPAIVLYAVHVADQV